MGGQQALEWAIMKPELIDNLILVATNAVHSSWGIAFNESQRMSIEVDPTLTEEQILEGLSREVMRKIQQARKNADLKLDARISLTLWVEGKLLDAAKAHESTLKAETLCTSLSFVASKDALKGTHTEVATDVEEGPVGIGITVNP